MLYINNLSCPIKVYYSPTNAQVIVLKTILKFTLKLTLASTDNVLPEDGVTAPKHVGAILM
jgi:hypothetical protein